MGSAAAAVTGRLPVGPALGACLVAFAVQAGLFIRDLVLSGQTCSAVTGAGPAGPILFEVCMARVQAAAARLRWEIGGLVVAGGLVGAALARGLSHYGVTVSLSGRLAHGDRDRPAMHRAGRWPPQNGLTACEVAL